MPAPLSVVVTVFQDRVGLSELLPALAAQDRPAEEIVIVDAGSDDGSAELIEYWRQQGLPLTVLQAPGAGISAGRNHGILAAANERIAVTDAGCRPSRSWLSTIARELEHCDFVGGTYTVDLETPFEHAAAVSLYPDVSEARGQPDLLVRAWQAAFGRRFRWDRSTGRSMAFTRECWELAGGFPEHVDWGEDVAFSAAVPPEMRAALAPEATVAWRGRAGWRENAVMYWRYAKGDAMLGLQPRVLARALVWAAGASLALRPSLRSRAIVTAGGLSYASLPCRRAWRSGLALRHWWRIPALLALKDVSMLAGTIAGLRARSDERR